jgi:hypothetical protein
MSNILKTKIILYGFIQGCIAFFIYPFSAYVLSVIDYYNKKNLLFFLFAVCMIVNIFVYYWITKKSRQLFVYDIFSNIIGYLIGIVITLVLIMLLIGGKLIHLSPILMQNLYHINYIVMYFIKILFIIIACDVVVLAMRKMMRNNQC